MKGTANRTQSGMGLGLMILVLGAVALTPAVRAGDVGQGVGGAARLSSVEGQVRLSQGGQVIADPAVINAPLFAGTQIQTGDDGKAEIQFDDGSVARLSPDSALTLTAVGAQGSPQSGTDMVLAGGLGYFELQGGAQGGQMRITFGDSVATASGFTVMRIRMDNPPGELAVFSGNAHLARGNAMAVDLHGGESVTLSAADPTQYNLAETIEPDSWDAWNSDRDQALNAEAADQTGAANNFINSNAPNPEWNDLDANGNWYNVPGEGYIWSPYDASNPGWDPYGNGNWINTPGYGYIFASGYPWGFMPYQCGMWNYYNGFGWGWAPGMDANFRMGGCHPWWGGGGYRGINIGRAPIGYRPIPMPHMQGPIGRGMPPKVISVNRGNNGKMGGVPVRNLNTAVEINGKTVMPMRPLPAHQSYQSNESGFVYRPTGGYRGTNTGSGYVYSPPAASNAHVSPGQRQAYTPPESPRYTLIPPPPPPPPPGPETPGATPGAAPGGKPAMGGLVPRGYNGGNNGGQTVSHPYYGGNTGARPAPQPYVRPSNGGGSVSWPAPPPAPRPSGGGGGAPHSSGGGGGPHK